jgi:hypothetical protein
MPAAKSLKQVNLRVGPHLYSALETIARDEHRSLPQAARLLLEEGLRNRAGIASTVDDTPASEVARIAAAGGAFDWLDNEPDLYDDSCGEPA